MTDGWPVCKHHPDEDNEITPSFPPVSWQEDDVLQFLSQEEQECLQFFEETIDSLEESLEENNPRPGQLKPVGSSSSSPIKDYGGPLTSSPNPGVIVSSRQARPSRPKDQDIIDLVRPEPDLVQNRDPIFNPTCPGRTTAGCCM